MIYSYARKLMMYSYARRMMIHYRLQLDRDNLPETLEPASTIDIARKMAGDLANAYLTEDPGRDNHDDSFEQSKDIAKEVSYWQTIFRSLKKST